MKKISLYECFSIGLGFFCAALFMVLCFFMSLIYWIFDCLVMLPAAIFHPSKNVNQHTWCLWSLR